MPLGSFQGTVSAQGFSWARYVEDLPVSLKWADNPGLQAKVASWSSLDAGGAGHTIRHFVRIS